MYPPHHLGGYELSCRDVVDRWRAAGHDVTVLTTDLRFSDVQAEPDEQPFVRRELSFYWRDHEIVTPSLREALRIERLNQGVLQDALADVSPDVVSAWHMGAMSLGLLTTVLARGIPLALVVCDDWLIYAPTTDAWISRFAGRPTIGKLLKRATGIPTELPDLGDVTFCFVSEWIRQRAGERSPWTPRIATVAYTGIDQHDFPLAETADRPWRWQLLCVGRVEERKGVHVALEALAQLPEAHLVISGPADESYAQRLRSLIASLGVADRVTFTRVPRDELYRLYTQADALLFPVLWDEPFGLVPVEAMACGTPVVGTVAGGSREFLIDGANCLAVAPGDASALAAAVERLATDDTLRAQLVRGGRVTTPELSVDVYADYLERWHTAVADGFPDGQVPHRPPILSVLAAKGLADPAGTRTVG